MKNIKGYIQQGDVLLFPMSRKDVDVKRATKHRTPILQFGESTGHAHRLDSTSGYMIYELWNTRYLELKKPITLRHEEHKPIRLLKGFYRIGIVQEYDHFREEQRKVRD